MNEFIMMVGIPGCGKSYKSKELAAKGYAVHSSDALRDELNMHEGSQCTYIFELMHKNTNRSRDMAILAEKLFSKLYIYVLDKHNYA